MNISKLMKEMIAYSDGNLHDINHLIKVYTYAKTIGELEGLGKKDQEILEAASILHDIACPVCREKYGNTNGKFQEQEGMVLAKEFLKNFEIEKEDKERIVYLIGHHHTFLNIHGLDYQILLEADYIVNAEESGYSLENIRRFCERVFKTESGIGLLKSIYRLS